MGTVDKCGAGLYDFLLGTGPQLRCVWSLTQLVCGGAKKSHTNQQVRNYIIMT